MDVPSEEEEGEEDSSSEEEEDHIDHLHEEQEPEELKIIVDTPTDKVVRVTGKTRSPVVVKSSYSKGEKEIVVKKSMEAHSAEWGATAEKHVVQKAGYKSVEASSSKFSKEKDVKMSQTKAVKKVLLWFISASMCVVVVVLGLVNSNRSFVMVLMIP